ncbi:hypothetical protein Q7P37_010373 [Cladosporium fusiforme]
MTRAATVSVHALSAGYLTLPERFFVTPLDDAESRKTVPSLSFLIAHTDQSTGNVTRLVFDLGIRKRLEDYPKKIYEHASTRHPLTGAPDVVSSLQSGGLGPEDIDGVIFSHLHWDHVGTPSDFEMAAYIIGPGAGELINGAQQNGSHNHFEPGLLDPSRTIELRPTDGSAGPSKAPSSTLSPHLHSMAERLSKPWQRKGQFEHALDVFGDSSLHIVSAPGHLPGHINLLCRTESAGHVYLAGDACHDARLLTGEKEVATWLDEHQSVCCIHSDKKQAEQTLSVIRRTLKSPGSLGEVEVIFAHDADWELDAKKRGRFLPGKL